MTSLAAFPCTQPVPSSADERALRRLLAQAAGMPGTYFDDGEAFGQELGVSIDFLREPVAAIESKLYILRVARLKASGAVAMQ